MVRPACNMKMRKKSSDSLEPARRAYTREKGQKGTERGSAKKERERLSCLEGGAVWRRATGNDGTRRRRNIEREKEIERKRVEKEKEEEDGLT